MTLPPPHMHTHTHAHTPQTLIPPRSKHPTAQWLHNYNGASPLLTAVYAGDLRAVRLLLERGADVYAGATCLRHIVLVCKVLLEKVAGGLRAVIFNINT